MSDITDREPPFVNNAQQGNADTATYRLFGRTYFADLRLTFQ